MAGGGGSPVRRPPVRPPTPLPAPNPKPGRSGERRVGEKGRTPGGPGHLKKKKTRKLRTCALESMNLISDSKSLTTKKQPTRRRTLLSSTECRNTLAQPPRASAPGGAVRCLF